MPYDGLYGSLGGLYGEATDEALYPAYHVILGGQGLMLTQGGYERSLAQSFAAPLRTTAPSADSRLGEQAIEITHWGGGEGAARYTSASTSMAGRYRRGANVDIFTQADSVSMGPNVATAQSTAFNAITCLCVYRGNLFAGTSDGKVYRWTGSVWALSRDTGKSTGGITAMITYKELLMVANGQDGVVEQYTGASLTTTWTTAFTATPASGPDFDIGTVTGIYSLAVQNVAGQANIWFGASGSLLFSYVGYAKTSTTADGYRVFEPKVPVLLTSGSNLLVFSTFDTSQYTRFYTIGNGAYAVGNLSYQGTRAGNYVTGGTLFEGKAYLGTAIGGQIWRVDGSEMTTYHQFGTVDVPYNTPITAMLSYQDGLWVGLTEAGGTLAVKRDDGSGNWSTPVSGLVGTTPSALGQFGGQLYFAASATGASKLYQTDGTFAASGNVETGLIDGGLPGDEKLWTGLRITHSALVSGQSVQVQYQVEDTGAWTTLGTSSTVGATGASFLFPPGVLADQIGLKILLAGTGGSATPLRVFSLTVRYLPAPSSLMEWSLRVILRGTTAQPMKLSDGTNEPLLGEEISAYIWDLIDVGTPVAYLDIDRQEYTVTITDWSEHLAPSSIQLQATTIGWELEGQLRIRVKDA